MVSVGEGTGDPAPRRNVLPGAGPTPSWGRVLATTIKLSVAWRLRALRRSAPSRWRLAALVLILALVAVVVVRLTGTSAPAARAPAAGPAPAGGTGSAGHDGTSSMAAARSQAAAWVAAQVSGAAIVACYPDMCAALQAQGVSAGRLMPLRSGAASPLGASVLVTSPSVRGQLADEDTPALVASFGSGGTRIEVRAVEPGGAAAYQSALRADLAARRTAGSELARNWHIHFTAQDVAQLRAGEVDSRLLATLAALASQYSFRVPAFGDASPGAQVLLRGVTITSAARGNKAAGLAAPLALVRAQNPPYLPAHATIAGQAVLTIEFAAPSPLGLLTPVLTAEPQRAAAVAGALPLGSARTR